MYASSMKIAVILAMLAGLAAAQSLQGAPSIQPAPGLQPAPASSAATGSAASPRAGTGGDLVLLTLVNGLGDATAQRKPTLVGDQLDFGVHSPKPLERMPFILAQLHLTGAVLQSPYPGIALDPLAEPVALIQAAEIYGAAGSPTGFRGTLVVPPGLSGRSLLMQGFSISAAAQNGIFESTAAHEFVIQ